MRRFRKCAECYSNRHKYQRNWSTMLCDEPHLIVWAEYLEEYWPAKVMKVEIKPSVKVYVQLFAERADTEISDPECFVYSEEYPGDAKTHPAYINAAIEVIIIDV